jgi:SAM-dependent methyltransferase
MASEFTEVTARQQRMWATGDFQRIGVQQVIVGEMLVRTLHVHPNERVLDVAGGAGNTAIAAARRGADAVCTDYVPDLLTAAAARAEVEDLPLSVQVADAQALPFPDAAFDVVTSTFGAMFAPDQPRTAAEILRVLRPGGRLGMANWTPDSWVGHQFALSARHRPGGPPPGVPVPTVWGTREGLRSLLADGCGAIDVREEYVDFMAPSTAELFELFRDWFGPVATVWAALDDSGRTAYEREWIELADRFNAATDGTCEIPGAYLEVVAVRN